jgi:Domain of unknown function (DUF4381)
VTPATSLDRLHDIVVPPPVPWWPPAPGWCWNGAPLAAALRQARRAQHRQLSATAPVLPALNPR